MNSTTVEAGSKMGAAVKLILSGLGLVVLAGLLVVALAVFELRLGKVLVGVVFLGGLGLLQVVLGVIGLLVHAVREKRYRLLAGAVAMLLALGGVAIGGYRYYYGYPLAGDQLVALLGESLDSPQAQSALKQLGQSGEHDEDVRRLSWRGHRLEMGYTAERIIRRIGFGTSTNHPYRGNLPFGLQVGDSRATVQQKLGAPAGETSSDFWDYPDRQSLFLVFRFGELRTASVTLPDEGEADPTGE